MFLSAFLVSDALIQQSETAFIRNSPYMKLLKLFLQENYSFASSLLANRTLS